MATPAARGWFEGYAAVRVAVDCAAFKQGGAERQVLDLGRGLAQRGHRVLLIVNQRIEGYVDELAGAPFDAVELRRRSGYDVSTLGAVYGALRGFRPDVCLCVELSATLWGRLAAVAQGVPVVIAEHLTTKAVARRRRAVNRLLAPATRAVVGCAQAQVPSLEAAGNRRRAIRVVPNGVDVEGFGPDQPAGAMLRDRWGIPSGAFVVAHVAAHRPEKRFDRFVTALERLSAERPAACVWGVSAGGGPLLEDDRRLAESSGVAGHMVVLGPCDDVHAVYAAADVVVLVSDDIESFPQVFLEGQACALPVVGMDVGGVRETVLPGSTGLLVPDGDIEGLCDGLASLLDDEERRRGMGAAGREFVAMRYSIAAMVQSYERILQAAARGDSPQVVEQVWPAPRRDALPDEEDVPGKAQTGDQGPSAAADADAEGAAPTVSIVMATYQRASTLPRAIDSVLAQTHQQWELIVVDDGSTDETPQVLERYQDPRIRILRLPENQGVCAARNAALDVMRGAWFTLLDSDDELFPEALSTLLAVPPRVDPSINAVTCNCIDSQTGLFSGVGLEHDQYVDLGTEVQSMSGEHWGITRRDVLGDLRFATDVPGGEDVLFYRLSARARRYYVHTALRVWHTEDGGRLTSRDTTDDLTKRGQLYLALAGHAEYVRLLRRYSPRKYAQLAFNVALAHLGAGELEAALPWYRELRVVGSTGQVVFIRCGLLLGARWTRSAFVVASWLRGLRR